MNANSSRTVLITGASRGLGRAAADRLAKEGYQIIGVARSLGSALVEVEIMH